MLRRPWVRLTRPVGASGARYDRGFAWSVLEQRYPEGAPDEWETSDFACRSLGDDTFLLT